MLSDELFLNESKYGHHDHPRPVPRSARGLGRGPCNDPRLDGFLAAHPHVRLDLAVSNEVVDIVDRRYDAGVQLGEVLGLSGAVAKW